MQCSPSDRLLALMFRGRALGRLLLREARLALRGQRRELAVARLEDQRRAPVRDLGVVLRLPDRVVVVDVVFDWPFRPILALLEERGGFLRREELLASELARAARAACRCRSSSSPGGWAGRRPFEAQGFAGESPGLPACASAEKATHAVRETAVRRHRVSRAIGSPPTHRYGHTPRASIRTRRPGPLSCRYGGLALKVPALCRHAPTSRPISNARARRIRTRLGSRLRLVLGCRGSPTARTPTH